MNLLVTAGYTLVPIDRVRCITNVFTGTQIALHDHARGHTVELLLKLPLLCFVALLRPRPRATAPARRS
jgi:phosphopantothenate-cysteine ligase/phosphopantothenoylcysteine decarboxylase/phosphopantothenate--cysteine ligase